MKFTNVMNCQHNELVESLECYMDEVIESFEDFVKKSLLLFSAGVCTVVIMLVYVLKMLTDRRPSVKQSKIATICPISSEKPHSKPVHEVTVQHVRPNMSFSSTNTSVVKSCWPSHEEQVLRNISVSNCNKSMQIGESVDNLNTRIRLIDRHRERSIIITPGRRHRDLSLSSRIPELLKPPLEGTFNVSVVAPTSKPISEKRDLSKVDTAAENQGGNGEDRQFDNHKESITRKQSIIELYQHLESKSAKKKCGKLLAPARGDQREVTHPARRCHSPASQPVSPNTPKPAPQRKTTQKLSNIPRYENFYRKKK